jgi:hypothetical protein
MEATEMVLQLGSEKGCLQLSEIGLEKSWAEIKEQEVVEKPKEDEGINCCQNSQGRPGLL